MKHPTVQDIFLRFYPEYLDKYTPSPQQSKAANCIINCKTGAYGANVSMCEDCGHLQIHYNSCRNRCCPMCQALPKEMWIDKCREDVLDAPYFHVVFTVPQELNSLIYSNQQLLYDAMYHSVSATINELTEDTKHLGAKVGYICVLHTWGSEMNYHPHIHVILLGGGLTSNNQWRDKGEEFFLPVKVLSKLFRGKYLDELKNLWEEKKLQFHGSSEKYRNHYVFKELLDLCYDKDWVPHCKKTFNGAQSVINYLGKYTHRIAISNHRIIRMDEDTVTYYVKDYREEGNWKEFTISGVEFIRRFLMHVPPKRFVRIRHYGLLCTRTKTRHLTLCRNLLGCKQYLSRLKDLDTPQMLETLYGIKVTVCKCCGGHLGKPQQRIPLRI
ncbi:IS91 family transposase [Blautia sp. Sow4_E7]|uniref:IS91 family transposase n=1 Tax=Blautia sp. Sow4_E7 TaxID=3438749 RepID=UPI003F8F54EF